jgi:hypothetical protein
LIFVTRVTTFVASAGFAFGATRDLNMVLHLGHSKIPTRNSGISPLAVRLAGATIQHLTATATFVPQFGQSAIKQTSYPQAHLVYTKIIFT